MTIHGSDISGDAERQFLICYPAGRNPTADRDDSQSDKEKEMTLDVRKKSYKKIAMVCPYYKKDTPNCIFCTSFLEQSSLVLTFGDRGDKKEYQRRYCAGKWEKCRRVKMLQDDQ